VKWLIELKKWLTQLEKEYIVTIWDDQEDQSWVEWRNEIERELAAAKQPCCSSAWIFLIPNSL